MNDAQRELINLLMSEEAKWLQEGHEWRAGDAYLEQGSDEVEHVCPYCDAPSDEYVPHEEKWRKGLEQCLWLPPLSDPFAPERSLLGMLGNDFWQMENVRAPDGSELWICYACLGNSYPAIVGVDAKSPEAAVLRALIWQRGKEGE